MSTTLARAIAATALAGSAFVGTSAADAACYGSQNIFVACYANRVAYSDCIYTGSGPCKPVAVYGPVCIYGTVLQNGYYTTVYC